ncbi:hypothetical protein D3C75_1105490 [compost metagenome]
MGPGTGIDQHGIHPVLIGLMDALAQGALEVALEALDLRPQLLAQGLQRLVDVGQGRCAVLARVTLAEHVVVDAMQHQYIGDHRPTPGESSAD